MYLWFLIFKINANTLIVKEKLAFFFKNNIGRENYEVAEYFSHSYHGI